MIGRIWKYATGFLRQLKEDHVGAHAAQSSYFIILSFIPFIMLLLALLQYTPLNQADICQLARDLMPETLDTFVINIINEVYQRGAVTISISALLMAWSAGKAFFALISGMNTIYHVEERRNYVTLRIRSAVYVLLFVVAILLSLVILVFGNSIRHMILVKQIPVIYQIMEFLVQMKNVLSLAVFTFVFMLLYRFIPDRKATLMSQLPGATFTSISWYAFSTGFSIYVDYSKGFSDMYGSLTTLTLIMLWLYFCMYIVLVGAEINTYFEEEFRRFRRWRSESRKN